MMASIPNFPKFDDSDSHDAGPKWDKWVSRLELLFDGMKLTDDKQKRALLLHYAGDRVFDIYETQKGDSQAKYEETVNVLKNYFAPRKNIQMEIYKFRNYKQASGQSLDEFVTELRRLARSCDFHDAEKEILSTVIQNCRSNRLRRRALRETDKTLNDILTVGRTIEIAETHAQAMETNDSVNSNVNAFNVKSKRSNFVTPDTFTSRGRNRGRTHRGSARGRSRGISRGRENPIESCRNCGGNYPHRGICPAKGKTCFHCRKRDHFSKVCRKRESVKEIHHEGTETLNCSSDDEYCYNIGEVHRVNFVGTKTPRVSVKVNGFECDLLVDTGASVNILDEATHRKIGSPAIKYREKPHLVPYGGGHKIDVLGVCELRVETDTKSSMHNFCIVKGNHGGLIGYPSCVDLDLVRIVRNISASSLCDENKALFYGIGKYKGKPVKLHIDQSVKPVAQRHRRTPFHLRPKVEAEINKLLQQDIIEKIDGTPTPWVSPIVTPPKKGPKSNSLVYRYARS